MDELRDLRIEGFVTGFRLNSYTSQYSCLEKRDLQNDFEYKVCFSWNTNSLKCQPSGKNIK